MSRYVVAAIVANGERRFFTGSWPARPAKGFSPNLTRDVGLAFHFRTPEIAGLIADAFNKLNATVPASEARAWFPLDVDKVVST